MSSIIFLNNLNLLESFRKRRCIYSKNYALNWLKEYNSNIDFGHLPTNFSYLDKIDEKPTLHVATQEDIDSFKEKKFLAYYHC